MNEGLRDGPPTSSDSIGLPCHCGGVLRRVFFIMIFQADSPLMALSTFFCIRDLTVGSAIELASFDRQRQPMPTGSAVSQGSVRSSLMLSTGSAIDRSSALLSHAVIE
jgi:hypothetical protein